MQNNSIHLPQWSYKLQHTIQSTFFFLFIRQKKAIKFKRGLEPLYNHRTEITQDQNRT